MEGSSSVTGKRLRCWAPELRKKSVHYTKSFKSVSHESEKMLSKAAREAQYGAQQTRCSAIPGMSQKLC